MTSIVVPHVQNALYCTLLCVPLKLIINALFRHFIFCEQCVHFNALYFLNERAEQQLLWWHQRRLVVSPSANTRRHCCAESKQNVTWAYWADNLSHS